MFSLITGASKKGIRFTNEEIGAILSILKEGKSPEEQAQIDRMTAMVQAVQKKNTRQQG